MISSTCINCSTLLTSIPFQKAGIFRWRIHQGTAFSATRSWLHGKSWDFKGFHGISWWGSEYGIEMDWRSLKINRIDNQKRVQWEFQHLNRRDLDGFSWWQRCGCLPGTTLERWSISMGGIWGFWRNLNESKMGFDGDQWWMKIILPKVGSR